ncbi:MAG: DEAD/DEAH box helicase [Treponema sp.]|jgi:ATP-dependent Lhr-like helicase|nr:DEAD/DEAH box helicase [Treponema sp.]
MASSFERLDPRIREYIYEKRWKTLKEVQERTIGEVLDGGGHILIAAGTAAGKTEAAFFPILTLIAGEYGTGGVQDGAPGLHTLYIGPLKALINDQFERLTPLLRTMEIPLWRWHGDVESSRKGRFLEKPGGILQITPESLEALLLRRAPRSGFLFGKLRFVVIDEIHAFMGTPRGSQVLCLLERLRDEAGASPRRVGLSATLGNYGEAMEWLSRGTGMGCVLAGGRGEGRRAGIAVDHHRDGGEYLEALAAQCRGDRETPDRKCVIFTNSRQEAEETIGALKRIARERRDGGLYRVHHGSMAAALREETERELREWEGPMTAAATATLELGIDIGKLDRIIQIGPPQSAAAFIQRLGRSGRRTGLSRIYFTSLEPLPPAPPEASPEELPWGLLRTLAVIRLCLKEKWIEGMVPQPFPFSLLCHEILAILAGRGECPPGELRRRVLGMSLFSGIEEGDYGELLDRLCRRGILQKTGEGGLIIGLEGDRIVNHYSFYAVFPGEEEYRVTQGGRELGKIHFLPPLGSSIALGGRYWRVEAVDRRSGEIAVSPGGPGAGRLWRGGGAAIHRRIAEGMRDILFEDASFPCLTENAARRLAEGRRLARNLSLEGRLIIPGGELPGASKKGHAFYLLPWMGSRGLGALSLVLQKREFKDPLGIISLERKNEFLFRIVSRLPPEPWETLLRDLARNLPSPEDLAAESPIPLLNKYDYLLPARLLRKQYAAAMLDLGELRELLGAEGAR